MTTLLQRLFAEGKAEGRAEGVQVGEANGLEEGEGRFAGCHP